MKRIWKFLDLLAFDGDEDNECKLEITRALICGHLQFQFDELSIPDDLYDALLESCPFDFATLLARYDFLEVTRLNSSSFFLLNPSSNWDLGRTSLDYEVYADGEDQINRDNGAQFCLREDIL